ncbi:MAG TPA: Wzz/FepE/Etk N-terminal domain-containing protein [Steroidobacteraceae bacterium]|nr:Wzz/FepE/Etk N-terminal domain-containing protein [Steroidobacteraceae bacterium]
MASTTRTTEDEKSEVIDFVALWSILWKRKLLIVAAVVLSVMVAAGIALTTREMFRAEVAVVEAGGQGGVADLTRKFGGLASLAGVELGSTGGAVQNAQAILKSRRLVQEFIVRNNLLAELYSESKEPESLWRSVEMFRRHILTIREDKRANVLTVSISWRNPATAANWANGFVALANEWMRDQAVSEAKRSIEYLNAQIKVTNIVELQQVMYSLIENETKTLMLANARLEYAFTVVDPAVAPEQRYSPRRTFMVLVGGFLGGLIGVAAAFGLEYWARRKLARGQVA